MIPPLEGEEIPIIFDIVDAAIGWTLMSPEERRTKRMRTESVLMTKKLHD